MVLVNPRFVLSLFLLPCLSRCPSFPQIFLPPNCFAWGGATERSLSLLFPLLPFTSSSPVQPCLEQSGAFPLTLRDTTIPILHLSYLQLSAFIPDQHTIHSFTFANVCGRPSPVGVGKVIRHIQPPQAPDTTPAHIFPLLYRIQISDVCWSNLAREDFLQCSFKLW